MAGMTTSSCNIITIAITLRKQQNLIPVETERVVMVMMRHSTWGIPDSITTHMEMRSMQFRCKNAASQTSLQYILAS